MKKAGAQKPNSQEKDHLWLQISAMPYFRGLIRSVEAGFYEGIELNSPTLDLGCGDGHFASVAFDRKIDIGTDPWWEPLFEAWRRQAYQGLIQSDGAAQPFPDSHFASAVSNSVLEHIPHIDDVLIETGRILQPGALFIFCVPNERYLTELAIPGILSRFGLKFLANTYTDWFRRMSRVHHADPPEIWTARLKNAGFTLEKWWHYFSPEAMRVLEWGHYFGLPSLVSRWLTGRWILIPSRWNLVITHNYVKPYASVIPHEQGTFTFFIARKI